ncbi:unnamed protein product [Oppiella nova]|uniref:Lipocalin/cytosolic fatty-acid binding domain-containing protein n=1 Tax=Oppiella nova TaxID=334625 RepID=A0A7R9MEZ2_9ACAR|nr:unnamed protein product [Oppiella nova]CAG2174934.1 unnamed protein product [Oppiella nova]
MCCTLDAINLAKTSTPVVEITKDGDVFSLKTLTAIKNSEIKFELGKEFEEARMDGKNVKGIIVESIDSRYRYL